MSRAVSTAVRQSLETSDSPDALLAFLTLTHGNLSDAIRVVSDVMDYVVGGQTFIGMPFGYRLLSDGDSGGKTQLVVQAIDRRITTALLASTERAKVRLELRSSADFNLSVSPRTETAANAPIYAFAGFDLVNVQGDALQITGDVELTDFTTEPWPRYRATQDMLPGLFR